VREGKLGKIGLVEIYCYYHMRNGSSPPDQDPPDSLDWNMWTGPAPLRPYNPIAHPRGWRAFMEYGNGIVGDMCVHMLDMVRWMLGLGWPKEVSSQGGIYIAKGSKSNIADTQTATFSYPDLDVVWNHRTWGETPAGMSYDSKGWDGSPLKYPRYPWGATIYGEKGTLEASVMGYTFTPSGGASVHKDVAYEYEKYPEDRTEKDLERHVAAAIRGHMNDLLACIESRGRPVADVEEGYISTATCILANLSMKLGRSLKFDPQAGLVTGDVEATKLLLRPYRDPWVHPGTTRS
jgi:predicted dehydrogenase